MNKQRKKRTPKKVLTLPSTTGRLTMRVSGKIEELLDKGCLFLDRMYEYLIPLAVVFWIAAFLAAIWTGRIGKVPYEAMQKQQEREQSKIEASQGGGKDE